MKGDCSDSTPFSLLQSAHVGGEFPFLSKSTVKDELPFRDGQISGGHFFVHFRTGGPTRGHYITNPNNALL